MNKNQAGKTVRLSKEQYEAMSLLATKDRRKIGQAVSIAIEQYLRRRSNGEGQ